MGVSLGDQVGYAAYGGNFIVLGKTGVTGGTAAAGVTGNEITAVSVVSGKTFTGGGVDIEGGVTTSTIAHDVANRPNPFQTVLSGQPVQIQGGSTFKKGEILVGLPATVVLNTNDDGTNGLFILSGQTNSVISIFGTVTDKVILDSVTITSSTPISFASTSEDADDVVVDASDD